MRKRILLSCFAIALFPLVSAATIKPIVTFSMGSDRANIYSSTTYITLIPPFQNAYVSYNHYDTEMVTGLFIGGEKALADNWALQLGLSYFQNSSFVESGDVLQFADPAFDNLSYQYNIKSRRVLVETKLSRTVCHHWHPYLTVGAGEAFNNAYAYIEYPNTSDAVPMSQPFMQHLTHSFTYMAGLGIDVDLGEHLRLGAGYRYADLGKASLGTTPLQVSTNTIHTTRMHTNEFLAQLSYVG